MKVIRTIAALAPASIWMIAAASLIGQPAAPPAKPAIAAPSYKSLQYPPLRDVKVPEVETATLANGIKVYLLENRELPLVSGFAMIRTGNLFDPPDKIGLATITGMVMRTGGTTGKSGDALDEQLENLAASVESSIGETSGRVGFNALRENTDEVLAVFKEVLTSPEFRKEKIDLAKGQMRGGIARRNDDADGIASQEFNETVYGRDNPFGWRMEYEHLERIERADLVNFYKRYFFPANTLLAVQGDFSAPEMKAKLEKLFSDWNVKQEPVPEFPKLNSKAAPGIYQASKDDVTQSFFQMGHLAGVLSDKNYPALAVMSDILGGGFSSRLFKRVRTQLGFAYGISANWGANYNHPGLFSISGSTKSASTVETLEAAREELVKMRDSEVTSQELSTAKDSVLNSFVFNFDNPGKTLTRLVTYDYYGYPKDFLFQYQKGVAGVTRGDVLRVAREYLKPADLTMVTVGNPASFDKPLSSLGEVKNIDLTIPEPKRAEAKTDAASLAKGKELLARAQKAMGGVERLEAVKDVTQLADVNVNTGQGELQVKQTSQTILPNQIRQTQVLPMGKMITYYDGKAGWLNTPQGQMDMPPPVARQAQGELFRNFFRLLLSDRDANRKVSASGPQTVEISGQSGDSASLEFDAGSGLLKKQSYRSAGMSGSPVAVEATYGDWKEVGGIQLPHKVTVQQDGKKFADVTVTEWKLNSGLTAEELSRKP